MLKRKRGPPVANRRDSLEKGKNEADKCTGGGNE